MKAGGPKTLEGPEGPTLNMDIIPVINWTRSLRILLRLA